MKSYDFSHVTDPVRDVIDGAELRVRAEVVLSVMEGDPDLQRAVHSQTGCLRVNNYSVEVFEDEDSNSFYVNEYFDDEDGTRRRNTTHSGLPEEHAEAVKGLLLALSVYDWARDTPR